MVTRATAHDTTQKQGVTNKYKLFSSVHAFLPKAIMKCASPRIASFKSSSISAGCLFVWFLFVGFPIICEGLQERLCVASKWIVGALQQLSATAKGAAGAGAGAAGAAGAAGGAGAAGAEEQQQQQHQNSSNSRVGAAEQSSSRVAVPSDSAVAADSCSCCTCCFCWSSSSPGSLSASVGHDLASREPGAGRRPVTGNRGGAEGEEVGGGGGEGGEGSGIFASSLLMKNWNLSR